MTQQYMFMLFDDEKWHDELTAENWADAMTLHSEFAAAVQAVGGQILGGAALQKSTTATTVHTASGGAPLITDGPFLETKEALGGFYLVEAADLDQALELARKCPSAHVEVRPVMDTGADAAPPS